MEKVQDTKNEGKGKKKKWELLQPFLVLPICSNVLRFENTTVNQLVKITESDQFSGLQEAHGLTYYTFQNI